MTQPVAERIAEIEKRPTRERRTAKSRRERLTPPVTPVIDRFWKRISPEPNSGCWLWTGYADSCGYGMFWDGWHNVNTHRWAYEHFVDAVPAGLVLDHKCRVRSCANPDHLRCVTIKENVLSGTGITAQNIHKTHCKRGHPYTADNLGSVSGKKNWRRCLKCAAIATAKYSRTRAASGLDAAKEP